MDGQLKNRWQGFGKYAPTIGSLKASADGNQHGHWFEIIKIGYGILYDKTGRLTT